METSVAMAATAYTSPLCPAPSSSPQRASAAPWTRLAAPRSWFFLVGRSSPLNHVRADSRRERQWRAAAAIVGMAPDDEKMTRRSPLDFPVEWDRPTPGRRPDIFPQFSPMKTPLPPPLPADPPEEDEDEEEKKEEDPDKEDKPDE